MTRSEHLQWAKDRALEYVDQGDIKNAMASIASDLQKHPETENHTGVMLGVTQMTTGHLSTPDQMRKFINGFN